MMSDMRLSCRDSHHRALAGGTSTSQLQSWGKQFGTPPGFSRWCFNFTTIKLGKTVGTPPGFSRWYFNFGATMRCSPESATKLKHHRLKRGGVGVRVVGSACSCEIEAPQAKARWCRGVRVVGSACSCEIEAPPAKARWCRGCG